jgi:hypothetical protein
MFFNIKGKSSRNKIINDLTLRQNRDNIGNGIIDRIYGTWIIFDNDKYTLYKISTYNNNTMYAQKFYSSNKKITDINSAISIIKNNDSSTRKISYDPLYSYDFYIFKHKNFFFDFFNRLTCRVLA